MSSKCPHAACEAATDYVHGALRHAVRPGAQPGRAAESFLAKPWTAVKRMKKHGYRAPRDRHVTTFLAMTKNAVSAGREIATPFDSTALRSR